VTRRYQSQSRPILLTTNKVFGEWNQVFPNATCVGTLVDRLVHRAEIVGLEGESYRLKEAVERTERKAKARKSTPRKPRSTP
jgi:DNA replication protein DnaC